MKKILFLILAISIIGCKKSDKKDDETKKAVVKLHQFVGGSIFVKKLEVFSFSSSFER